jgi:hypothetical protein
MAVSIFPDPLYSGDVYPLSLAFQNPDGTAYNLTGITVGCTVKKIVTDPDTAALYQQDIPGDSSGNVVFVITPLAAGVYYLDVKWWNTTQANQRTTVIGTTQMQINQSVTARELP